MNKIFGKIVNYNEEFLDGCFDKEDLNFILAKNKEHLLSLERTYVANSLKHPLFIHNKKIILPLLSKFKYRPNINSKESMQELVDILNDYPNIKILQIGRISENLYQILSELFLKINGMNFKYSFKNSPNDLKQVELINDTMSLLEIIKIHINTFQEEEYNAEDESDIAKYTPGWTVDEDGRPVQIDNVDVDDMMEDMSL